MGTILLIGFGVGIYFLCRKIEEWYRDDTSDYVKSKLEVSIEREIERSRYAQWKDRYPPPTYPDDL